MLFRGFGELGKRMICEGALSFFLPNSGLSETQALSSCRLDIIDSAHPFVLTYSYNALSFLSFLNDYL